LAITLLGLLALACVLADFLSVHRPDAQDLDRFFAPPARIRLVDASGGFHWRPFVYARELADPLRVVYTEDRTRVYPLEFFSPGYPYRFLGLIPTKRHLVSAPGTALHLWGTDELGRDVMARALAGAWTSLVIVALGMAVYSLIGLAVGAAAGLAGGWVDSGLMRLSEFVMALPALYLILAMRALMPGRMGFWRTALLMVATIASVAWPPLARTVRGHILQLRGSLFIEAAISLGATRWRVLSRHILPSLPPLVMAQAVLAAPMFLLGEVILSFLDVGFGDAAESWGVMLRNLKDPRVMTDFWWNLAPLALVFVTLLVMNVLAAGSGRREASRLY
jgi:peptide/nickel transport system permease protein